MTNEASPLLSHHEEEPVSKELGDIDTSPVDEEIDFQNDDNDDSPINEDSPIEGGNDSGKDEGNEPDDDSSSKPNPKQKGVKLTYANATILQRQVNLNMMKHHLAHEYFEYKQFYFFTLPQSLLSCFSAVLAFGGGSSMLSYYSEQISLFVGCLSALAVLFQTVGGIKMYGQKADRHDACSISLRDLRDDLVLIALKLQQIEKIKKSDQSKAEELLKEVDTFESIQKRYQQCLSNCSSTVPLRISEAFHGLDTTIELTATDTNNGKMKSLYPKFRKVQHDNLLKSKAYDIMAGEIINSKTFPAHLPDSKHLVKTTMRKLKKKLREAEEFHKVRDDEESEPEKLCWIV